MTLNDLQSNYADNEAFHASINEFFTEKVNATPELKAHRDYVEQNIWGFGERSFWWLWKLICDEVPEKPNMLEIGVFRGATLSLWRILKPDSDIMGVTPLDTSGDVWESNYADDIWKIHQDFGLEQPSIVPYRSESQLALGIVRHHQYDVVYIDGDHSYDGCMSDLVNYAPMVKQGGFLVIDDACCDMKMPWGYFQGIKEVTDATLTYIKAEEWEFVGNVVHLRVYSRK